MKWWLCVRRCNVAEKRLPTNMEVRNRHRSTFVNKTPATSNDLTACEEVATGRRSQQPERLILDRFCSFYNLPSSDRLPFPVVLIVKVIGVISTIIILFILGFLVRVTYLLKL